MGRNCRKASSLNIFFVLLTKVFYLTDGQVCDMRMTYHEHTETCIVLVKDQLRYDAAARHCRDEYSGGHLVYIFDQETDTFVRGLLTSVKEEALIGLHDHGQNGQYRWGDNMTVPSYFAWKFHPHYPSASYSNTVVTRRGWEDHGNSPARFICQTKPVLTKPRLQCPILEEKTLNARIECDARIQTKNQILSVSLGRNHIQWTNCSLTSCSTFDGYQGKLSINGLRVVLTTEISKVLRSDDGPLNCTINIGHNLMAFSTCDLKVYVVPSQPRCTHNFNKTHVIINCTATKAYPAVGCTWTQVFSQGSTFDTIHNKTSVTESFTIHHKSSVKETSTTSRTSCSLCLPIHSDGVYRYAVSMYPTVTGTELKNKSVITEGEVRIEAPLEEPQYFITNGVVQDGTVYAAENTTVVITCSVHGGSPLAQDIRIACDEKISDVTTRLPTSHGDGHIASMKIYVSRHMMNRSCRCSADHISGAYNLTAEIVVSLTNIGESFNELIIVHITTGACFILVALAAVIITLKLKGFIGGNLHDTDVKQEKQQVVNEYVGFALTQPTPLPAVQMHSPPDDEEGSVYHTIGDLPVSIAKTQGDYIEMARRCSTPSLHNLDTRMALLKVPGSDDVNMKVPESDKVNVKLLELDAVNIKVSESDAVNYENWQLPCEPHVPEADKDSEKDGYVFLRVLRRARDSFRKSLNYQNVKLPWKRSNHIEANQEN